MKTIIPLASLFFALSLLCSCKKESINENYVTYKGEKFIVDSCYERSVDVLVAEGYTDNKTKYIDMIVFFPSLPTAGGNYSVSSGSNAVSISMIVLQTDSLRKYYTSTGTDNAVLKVSVSNGGLAASCDKVRMGITPIPYSQTPSPDTTDITIHIVQTN